MKGIKMDKLEYALKRIANCDLCYGKGYIGFANGEDYDVEDCDCNPYGLLLDEDGEVIWDNGMLSEPELLKNFYNLSIFATQEAN